jgi:hypothetical protein
VTAAVTTAPSEAHGEGVVTVMMGVWFVEKHILRYIVRNGCQAVLRGVRNSSVWRRISAHRREGGVELKPVA